MAEGHVRRSQRIQNRKLAAQLGARGLPKPTSFIENEEKKAQKSSIEAQLFSDRTGIRSDHESSRSKSSSSYRSNSSKRTIIDAKKAAKRAEIQLEAAKKEAELRERAVQLENERQIQQKQVEFEMTQADLKIEEESLSSHNSDDCFKPESEEICGPEDTTRPYNQPLDKSVLRSVPKDTERDRVYRYFASTPFNEPSTLFNEAQFYDNNHPSNTSQQFLNLGKEIAKQRKPFVRPFDGKIEDFVHFKASIDRIINTGLYDDDELLNIIQENVTGEADTAIKGILPGSGQFIEAMKILHNRFGNERAIVQTNIAALRAHPVVQEKRADQLRSLSNVTCNMVQAFKSLHLEHDLKSNSTVQDAISKLPQSLFFSWHEQISEHPNRATLEYFNTWIERKAKYWEEAYLSSSMNKPTTDSKSSKPTSKSVPSKVITSQRRSVFNAKTSSDTKPSIKCLIHDSPNHQLENCKSFKGMDSSQRREVVYKHKLCYRCLQPGHMSKNCQSQVSCDIPGCSGKHHSLLHELSAQHKSPFSQRNVSETSSQSQPWFAPASGTTYRASCNSAQAKQAVLQILPVYVYGNDGTQKRVYAMLDSGCDCTLLSQQLATSCGFIHDNSKAEKVSITGVNGTQTVLSTSLSESIYVSSIATPYKKFALFDAQTVPQLPGPSQVVKWSEIKKQYSYLEDIDLHDIDGQQISLIIGSNNGRLLVPSEIVEPSNGNLQLPIALNTPLGWVATNCIPHVLKEHGLSAYRTTVRTEADYNLEKLVESHMNVDTLGITTASTSVAKSKDDNRAFNMMKSSTYKLPEEDRYVSKPLWKDKEPLLPDNYDYALRRLCSLERRLDKDLKLKERYDNSIKQDIEKNYIRKLSKEEASAPSNVKWFIPHHPVLNPHKPDKLRRVYDASAVSSGCSLNSMLYKGPDLLPSLLGLLLRFCEKPYALAADIQEMYHQIRIPDEDKPAMRFLWRTDTAVEPDVYQFERMIFGEIDAPARANYVVQLNAQDHRDLYPTVAEKVPQWFYMDDSLFSVDSVQEGIQVSADLTNLLAKGGFRLHKWLSNSVDILKSIPESERSTKVKTLVKEELPVGRTLGTYWDASEDTFRFTSPNSDPGNTRRKILSQVFSIWDPRGQIAPFVIRAKIFLQELWLHGKNGTHIGWDSILNDNQLTEWFKWFTEAKQLANISFPRPLRTRSFLPQHAALMIFCDASERAYACCAYLLLQYDDGSKECNLVAAKARVAPLKKISIPRLELMGAVMGVRLADTLFQELDITIHQITFWLDSAIVLQWVNRSSTQFHAFVGNRVTEINDVLTGLRNKIGDENVCMRYVPTKLNPADDATRGLHISKITASSRWQTGPDFLTAREDTWPERRFEYVEEPTEELKKVKWVGLVCHNIDVKLFDITKYSSFSKLQRIVSYCFRFMHNCRTVKACDRKVGVLTVKELELAERFLIMRAQAESFPEEIEALQSGKLVSSRSHLIKLSPQIENGLLVVGGRLNYAPLPRITKHPIILDSKHGLVKLLLSDCHRSLNHPGANYLLYSVRKRYWIIGARNTIRKLTHNCVTCRKLRGKPSQPIMADLPAVRVTPGKFFDKVGVDYFGPIMVKRGRSEIKRYGCIFTCLKIRAVHIELAEDLSTDSFILCLRNFIGRRGQPSEMFSDNGTNFVGAEGELKQGLLNLDQEKIENFLAPQRIEWHFNPAAAPHMGGVWERMVQCIKRPLYAILKGRVVQQEVLRTTLIEIEAFVNSRPIGCISADVGDLEALSPYHFLLIRPHLNVSFDVICDQDVYSRKLWKVTQALANMYWKRWMKEYVASLTERSKWFGKPCNLHVGDVVLVTDGQKSRGQWLLGRVLEVHLGKDGYARSACVKTQFGTLSRPVNRLCLLESL